MNKEITKLIRDLKRKKWRIEQGKKHYKCHHPEGGYVVIACTPSDYHGPANAKKDVEKLEIQNRG